MVRIPSWQQEFEESFPYDETDDQLNAIEDIKAGYGKQQGYGQTDLR